jgi:hypothetical protein
VRIMGPPDEPQRLLTGPDDGLLNRTVRETPNPGVATHADASCCRGRAGGTYGCLSNSSLNSESSSSSETVGQDEARPPSGRVKFNRREPHCPSPLGGGATHAMPMM